MTAIARQNYEEAARYYQRAIELRPRSHVAHYNLARALLLLGRNSQAEAEAKIAEANGKIAVLEAAGAAERGRKTLPAGVARMLGKEGVVVDGLQAESIDAALL